MKVLTTSVVSLLVGYGVGCCFGYWYCNRCTTNEAVAQAVQGSETSAALQAALGARAIELIESGDTEQAVQLLSGPVARYYVLDMPAGRNDERSAKLRALIEEVARTNQVVAARITEISNIALPKTP